MEFWLYVLLFSLPSLIEYARDPVSGPLDPGLIGAADVLRGLDCEPASYAAAREQAPGRVTAPPARGDVLQRKAVICRARLMPPGVRRARDEAILSNLRESTDEMAGLVAGLAGPLRARTWLVEAYYPEAEVAAKVQFAAKNALMARGVRVTDRTPALAAGDVEVLGRIDPQRAWPLACTRYTATGSLGPNDALMGVALRDRRATILNVGYCADGAWRWLR